MNTNCFNSASRQAAAQWFEQKLAEFRLAASNASGSLDRIDVEDGEVNLADKQTDTSPATVQQITLAMTARDNLNAAADAARQEGLRIEYAVEDNTTLSCWLSESYVL